MLINKATEVTSIFVFIFTKVPAYAYKISNKYWFTVKTLITVLTPHFVHYLPQFNLMNSKI